MQSFGAHHAPHYTVQALCARGKRAVVLPHAFGLRSIVAGWTWCATSMASAAAARTADCDDNDAQPDASAAATTTATTTMNRKKKVCMQLSCAHDAPHYTAQSLRAREKRAVALPHDFGLLASVLGWTFA